MSPGRFWKIFLVVADVADCRLEVGHPGRRAGIAASRSRVHEDESLVSILLCGRNIGGRRFKGGISRRLNRHYERGVLRGESSDRALGVDFCGERSVAVVRSVKIGAGNEHCEVLVFRVGWICRIRKPQLVVNVVRLVVEPFRHVDFWKA